METIIDWKPSELLVDTVITCEEGTLIKSEGYPPHLLPYWDAIGVRDGYSVEDEAITKYEILSVPPAWYEDFKLIPGSTEDVRINRQGWILKGGLIILEQERVMVGRVVLSIASAVRKAFV